MSMRDMSLSTRITLWALLFVLVGGVLWVSLDMDRDRESYLARRTLDLQMTQRLEQMRLKQKLEALRQDVEFMAAIPPVSGIVRASGNKGMDARDRTSNAVWMQRMQEIFAAFLRAHPEYSGVRFIGVADAGRELVRAEYHAGQVVVVSDAALQALDDRNFFKLGLTLTAGRVRLSGFEQEPAQGNQPALLVLHAVTPIFDASGRVFGMLDIDQDVQAMFDSIMQGQAPEFNSFVSDEQGHYLFRRDAGPATTLQRKMQDDFPGLAPVLAAATAGAEAQHQITLSDDAGGLLTAERVFFDSGDPARFMLLVSHLPRQAGLSEYSAGVSASAILNMLLVVALVSGAFMLILRYTFAPLKRITAAALQIASGNRNVRLAEPGKGEIGELSVALNRMLDKLTDSDLIEQENAFRKELIDSLPGIFYMLDMQGRFHMWNLNLEQVLQVSSAELAASHPLDFFAGEDKSRIERAIRQAFEQGETLVEAELVSKDGVRTPYQFTGRRVLRDGVPLLVGLGLNVSRLRHNLREMGALLRRNQALMQNSMEGIHVLDMDGRVLEANTAFCEMLGYTQEEIVRLCVSDWDTQFTADELRARIRSFIGKSGIFETMHRRKDGSLLQVEICFTGIMIDAVGYLFASSRDVTERHKMQAILQRHQQVIETAMDGFWMTNAAGFLEEANESYARMSGYTIGELLGMHISQLEVFEHPQAVSELIGGIMTKGHARYEARHRRKDGRVFDVEVSSTYMQQSNKIFTFSHNITRRRQAEEALRVAAATFETHDGILITDADANIVRVNRAFVQITGYTAEEVIGRNPRMMSSGRHDNAFYAALWQQLLVHGSWSGEIWDRRKNGEIYPKWMSITAVKDEHGVTTEYVAIFSDITQRKLAEDEIRNLAFYDTLTQLPNRRLFMERFQAALSASARYADHGAILFIDLDRFKNLNDTLGHDYGDLLLIEVAARIRSCVREIDTVSRFGGDEFVVLLESISGTQQEAVHKAGLVAEKIRETLSASYQLREHVYASSPSIGISLYHNGEDSMETLLKHADAAMYQAKDTGRNRVRFFEPSQQQYWEGLRLDAVHWTQS